MMELDNGKEIVKGSDCVQWGRDSQKDVESIAYQEFDEGTEIEQVFALKDFLHGRNIQTVKKEPHHDRRRHPDTQQEPRFDGPKIDARAKRSSVISVRQYCTYPQTFDSAHSMKCNVNR